jgi:cation-transporting ATPase 13A1
MDVTVPFPPYKGESVPQMKEALIVDDGNRDAALDITGVHRVNMLWGGTRILQQTSDEAEKALLVSKDAHVAQSDEARAVAPRGVPAGSPDAGCVAMVLRTGFNSSQGIMVRMIEFSSDNVSGNTKEAALLVLFLLCFAVAASAYVLKRGMEDERDSFSLLLHCILIITSVIPPELNMQMALAVNTSLLTLIKQHIFCTEPYRIPLAGKTSICLFDKTGTITTDELVASGVVNVQRAGAGSSEPEHTGPAAHPEEPITATNVMNSIILAGCHSLVEVDKETTGDPLEMAAIKSIKWTFDAATRIATPKEAERPTWPKNAAPSVEILHRYHFSSKLQRMSVIALVKQGPQERSEQYILTKGSPEALQALCNPATVPAWFHKTHVELTKQGRRVIALAYRKVESPVARDKLADMSREWAEQRLTFAGFFLFRCLLRRDSKDVINALKDSSHAVGMVTGDAILTAVHVAREVNMCREDRSQLLVLAHNGTKVQWTNADTEAVVEDFAVDRLAALSEDNDLCVTGDVRCGGC